MKGKIFSGKVVSIVDTKTIGVEIMHLWRHPLYQKALRKNRKFLVHKENQEVSLGDKVKIQETKPISKNKHFIFLNKII